MSCPAAGAVGAAVVVCTTLVGMDAGTADTTTTLGVVDESEEMGPSLRCTNSSPEGRGKKKSKTGLNLSLLRT